MNLQYTTVNAFTSTPFRGNPACVIILPPNPTLSAEQMQLIAREFNLPETAFLTPEDSSGQESEGVRRYGLRWFTPEMEFPICGHATLASAHVLFSTSASSSTPRKLKFDTLSGELAARRVPCEEGSAGGGEGEIEITLPAGLLHRPTEEMVERAKRAINAAIGKELEYVYLGAGAGVSYGAYLVVEVAGVYLEGLPVNPGPMAELADTYTTVILTHLPCPSSSQYTFVSRVFAPAEGIPEDPVTGSAHCLLAPYWSQKLCIPRGKEIRARQVSERGGEMGVIWEECAEGGEGAGRCRLRGEAVVVMRGEIVGLS